MRLLPLLVLGALATDASAQASQANGFTVTAVSSHKPGGIQVLVTPDARVEKMIGATPDAKDFTLWLGGGASTDLKVVRNGSRGLPLTTVVLLDVSLSYKGGNGHGAKVAVPAIEEYVAGAGTDELALIAFALDIKTSDVSKGSAGFLASLKSVQNRKGRATSVTIGLQAAIDLAAKEGEPGLREVIVFSDAGDEADVDKAVWNKVIAQAHERGVRVSVVLPTDDKLPAGAKEAFWVNTRTNLSRLATETGGEHVTTWDPKEASAKLIAARIKHKGALVVEGRLCGAKSGQPVDARVEYVPNAKREAWSGGAQLPAAAWAPGSDAPCPSLCKAACSAWEECIAGTCAGRACTADSSCLGGSVCIGGFCGKQCSPACASWQECKGGGCAARACAGDENCGAGSRCDKGMCTAPATKSSGKLIWILAGAGALLLLAALFVLFRKKPQTVSVVETPAPEPTPVVEEPKPANKDSAGVDLDPLPETHLVAIGGWATPGERWRLHKRKTIAGASSDASDGVDLVFGGIKQVSSKHAQFDLYPSGDLWVSDLGSSNGTFVNGKKVTGKERTKLVPGDQVKLSQNLILKVERPGAGESDDIPASAPVADSPAEPETPAAKHKAATKFDPGGR